jgi:hypothetical protein
MHERNDRPSVRHAVDITVEQRAFQVSDTAASEKGDKAKNSVAAQILLHTAHPRVSVCLCNIPQRKKAVP